MIFSRFPPFSLLFPPPINVLVVTDHKKKPCFCCPLISFLPQERIIILPILDPSTYSTRPKTEKTRAGFPKKSRVPPSFLLCFPRLLPGTLHTTLRQRLAKPRLLGPQRKHQPFLLLKPEVFLPSFSCKHLARPPRQR